MTDRTHDDLKARLRGLAKEGDAAGILTIWRESLARIEALEAALRANSAQLQEVFQAPDAILPLSWVDDTAEALSEAYAALGDKHG